MLFFFNDTATTEIYTLSLHDALPIFAAAIASGGPRLAARLRELASLEHLSAAGLVEPRAFRAPFDAWLRTMLRDRKSTRLNSSHANISYAVFCLKKKNIRA